MNKLCLPLLTLALGLPSLAHARDDKLPSPAAGDVNTSLTASASASASVTISDQDALNDDILSVIDLPVVAADAREAGIDEAELKEALDTTRDTGLSASDASEVVATEAEQTRKRGVKRGFGRWVRMQVAAGLRGPKLAAKIKERKADTAELDEKQQADLREKLEKQREINQNWRRGQQAKRGELIAKGKKSVLLHKERHDQLKAKIDAAQDKIDSAQGKLDGKQEDAAARLKEIEARLATAPDVEKPRLEAEKERLEKLAGKLEKREDKLEKAEEKLGKVEEKLEKREEKREERREAKAEAREAKGKAGHSGDDKPKAAGEPK
jgi:DNA repair exonuclease SbcCD ATPase subunit